MGTQSIHPDYRQITRHDAIFKERVHDSYKIKEKLPEPTVCPHCDAVFHNGRWQWLAAPANAHQHNCPACQRILDHYPAGFITLKGEFFRSHRDEILHLVQNFEKKEKSEHPLQRIISTEKQNDSFLITTTDIHLARGIGEAIHDAYQGELDFHYNQAENLLRVHWSR
ncbi:BCAM0308 family protein [Nitrosomonas sp.]|uniref:BCAM0308 family protein n=1 Tax=Nitrosomonas sp. TaxID=42353 RepID=UPI001D9D5CEC|nr:BCAM0308 family protein [Nitrosomonas sp.]MBX3616282.1 ATPase [Nitrosomonas sp.]